jgi:23S rRNA (guanine745-N1)-methyltransferase
MSTFALICPVCKSPLQQQEQRLGCEHNHSFDRARQGYWNLLLPQRKRSKEPGDSADMVQARQRFLQAGHYAPLARAIVDLLQPHVQTAQAGSLLDLGCGEGWYTDQLQRQLNLSVAGLDISKPAVRAASRRNPDILWLVATGADIPLADESVDMASLIFGRLLPEPTARVLKPGGLLLVVYPGPDHLRALRGLIYEQVRDSSGFSPEQALAQQFEPVTLEKQAFEFRLDSAEAVQDLLAMTPHGQRLNNAARERIAACSALIEQADFRLSLLRKR